MLWTHFIMTGAAFGALGVILGAFGAHALKYRLDAHYLAVFETGVRYQIYHAFALLCVGLLATRFDSVNLKVSGYLFASGTILFSGSLYLLTLSGIKVFGIITPFGGVLLTMGWLSLLYAVYKI